MIHEMQALHVHMDGVDIYLSLYIMSLDLDIETVSSIFIKNNLVGYFSRHTSRVFVEWKLSSK